MSEFSSLRVTSLHLYPIKSLGGISLDAAAVEPRGLRHDRRWMLVDETCRFLSQRELPALARFRVAVLEEELHVTAADRPPLRLPLLPTETQETLPVRIWRDTCDALPVSPAADAWFSDALGHPCRLVFLPETTHRPVHLPEDFPALNEAAVSFADGFPLLLTNESSLSDLNRRLSTPVPMNRFRPNVVVTGDAPFAEDKWQEIRISGTRFHAVKPCARCAVPTIDQQTGVSQGSEPLRTLATFRSVEGKVLFGQNLIPIGGGTLRVGDTVTVLTGK